MLELIYTFLDQNIFAFMSIHLAFLAALLILNFSTIKKQFAKIDKKVWVILLIIFIIGFSMRNTEYWYGEHSDAYAPFETAKFLMLEGKHVKACSAGRPGYCSSYQQVLQPVGFPYMISLFYILFGVDSLPVLFFSSILSSLSIVLVFLICYLLSRKEEAGLYAALIYALIPLDIIFSGTGSTRVMSVFFVGFSVLAYLIAVRKNDFKAWAFFGLLFSFSIYIRQENYILIPLFLAGLLLFRYDFKKTENLKKLLAAGVIFAAFQMHVFYWTFFVISNAFVHPFGLPTYSFECLIRMSPYITNFLLGTLSYGVSDPYSLFATILFAAGILIIPLSFLLKRRAENKLLFPLVWFALFFVVYGAYCMNFINGFLEGPDTSFVRYSLQFHIPYSLLAGYAFYGIKKFFGDINKHLGWIIIPVFVTLLIIPLQPPTTMFKDARIDHEAEYFSAIQGTPPNATIITQMYMLVSSDVVGGNRKYIDPEVLVLNGTPEHTISLLHNSEDVYYIELQYCDDLPDHQGCKFIRENLEIEPVSSEDSLQVYRVLVEPDEDYKVEWDSFLYEVEVRSNEIVNVSVSEI